jgi:hypothetical protein
LGQDRLFFHPESGFYGASLHGLLSRVPEARFEGLDPIGIASAWGEDDAPDRTCLAAIRAVPPGAALPPPSPRESDLSALLPVAMASALAGARRPIVALGGGVDAPLAVLSARRAGIAIEHAIHLSLPSTTYDESLAARETAAALDLSLQEVHLTTHALASALPQAARIAETPLYNLHPVSRLVVARECAARGYDVLLTGDGADQAARGATEPADYVPVVASLTRGAELTLASPFLDEEVIDLLVETRDPDKHALRQLAKAWGLPSSIADRPKKPCSAPPLPRASFPRASRLRELEPVARLMRRTFAWSDDDRSNVGIASLAAFAAAFEVA